MKTLLLLSISWFALTLQASETNQIGRFQIVSSKVIFTTDSGATEIPVTLKIDTVTGQTWTLNIGSDHKHSWQTWTELPADRPRSNLNPKE